MSPKILVADDDPFTRDLLSYLLADEGYVVLCAENGRQALALARRERPDLIITDLAMPDMDGLELIGELQGETALRSIPILVVSAYLHNALDAAVLAGASAGMCKPVDPDELVGMIRSFMPPTGQPTPNHRGSRMLTQIGTNSCVYQC